MRLMIRIEGRQRVEGYKKPDVFRAGIKTENWPSAKEGLIISPRDEIVVPGTHVNVGLAISALSLDVDGVVTQYDTNNSLLIEGESKLIRASVAIELNDNFSSDITEVEYEVIVEGKKLHIRLAEVAVRDFLKHAIPSFARAYCGNVTEYLQAESVSTRF